MAQRNGCSDGGHTNGGALHSADGHLAAIASAHFDDLTGILNRRGLLHRLQIAATEPGWVVAYIDVDRFKTINDSGGHGAGDEALRNVAAAISSTAAEGSIIGRLGGDEFVVASPMTVHPVVVGERIRDGVRQLGGRPTVSIGIANDRVHPVGTGKRCVRHRYPTHLADLRRHLGRRRMSGQDGHTPWGSPPPREVAGHRRGDRCAVGHRWTGA